MEYPENIDSEGFTPEEWARIERANELLQPDAEDLEEMPEEERLRQLEEMEKHGGEVVARRISDGTSFYASNYKELYSLIMREGIPLNDVSLSGVPKLGVQELY